MDKNVWSVQRLTVECLVGDLTKHEEGITMSVTRLGYL